MPLDNIQHSHHNIYDIRPYLKWLKSQNKNKQIPPDTVFGKLTIPYNDCPEKSTLAKGVSKEGHKMQDKPKKEHQIQNATNVAIEPKKTPATGCRAAKIKCQNILKAKSYIQSPNIAIKTQVATSQANKKRKGNNVTRDKKNTKTTSKLISKGSSLVQSKDVLSKENQQLPDTASVQATTKRTANKSQSSSCNESTTKERMPLKSLKNIQHKTLWVKKQKESTESGLQAAEPIIDKANQMEKQEKLNEHKKLQKIEKTPPEMIRGRKKRKSVDNPRLKVDALNKKSQIPILSNGLQVQQRPKKVSNDEKRKEEDDNYEVTKAALEKSLSKIREILSFRSDVNLIADKYTVLSNVEPKEPEESYDYFGSRSSTASRRRTLFSESMLNSMV